MCLRPKPITVEKCLGMVVEVSTTIVDVLLYLKHHRVLQIWPLTYRNPTFVLNSIRKLMLQKDEGGEKLLFAVLRY